ncbi:MAG: hypothetical protein HYX65_01770 [Gemmatimonadetes bacterium]|nr:hypothetical protein [Gemmatimonadota bacterium]
MIKHIDLGSVLRGTVSERYTNLVTRPTGHAVRGAIEQIMRSIDSATLTVIDFSHVGLLDFSCADEIIAKLLQRYDARHHADAPETAYFVFRGLNEAHLEAIEWVLQHHGLALVAEPLDGEAHLLGDVNDDERAVWQVAWRLGAASFPVVAEHAGIDASRAEWALDQLYQRRLLRREADRFVAVRPES